MYFGISEADIRKGLLNYRTVGMRQQIFEVGGVTLINDCYNASPESMRAAAEVLSTLAAEKGGRKIALLGDMLELGDFSDALHYSVGEHFGAMGVRLFTFGESAERIADGAAKHLNSDMITRSCATTDEDAARVAALIASEVSVGDCILIKASRRIAAERVSAELTNILGK